MPIIARQPTECFNKFRDHLGPLLAATLGSKHAVVLRNDGDHRRDLILGPPHALAGIPLDSSRGPFHFSMRQRLEVVPEGKLWRLTTREYRYAITDSKLGMTEALLRWEYIAEPPAGKKWCKHHFQIGRRDQKSVRLPFSNDPLDLNREHTPTGFVLIEYVLRFLLTDIGVEPARPDWEDVLTESEETFFTKFSGRTSAPPPP